MVCVPARGKACSSRSRARVLSAASSASVLSRMARLLSSMTWVARIAAPMATAMMASATRTSISVKPRCGAAWRRCRHGLLDRIAARRVALDADAIALRSQFQDQRVGDPFGAEHHRAVGFQAQAERRRAPGLRAQGFIAREAIGRLRAVILRRQAPRPSSEIGTASFRDTLRQAVYILVFP